MKKLFLLTVLCTVAMQGMAQDTTSTSVYFATSSWELDPSSTHLLDSVCTALHGQAGVKVQLTGHTDSRGSLGANDTLSQRRVNAVRKYLGQCGLTGIRVKAEAEGETRPVAANTTGYGMAQNRRVEIEVFTPAPQPSVDDAELNALLSCMMPRTQIFRMRCDTVQEIVAANGTVIVVPGGTFPCSDSLTLEVIEAYDKASILALKLTTVSGNALLESGGMVYLRATNQTTELKPRTGKGLMVLMPTTTPNAEMSTFYAEKNKNNHFTWPTKGEKSGAKQEDGSWGWMPRPYVAHYDKLQRHGYHKMLWSIGNAFRSEAKREKNMYIGDSRSVPDRWLLEADVRTGVNYVRVLRSGRADQNGNYNALYVQRTGWVNCDFFYQTQKKLIPEVVVTNGTGNSVAILYFNNHNVAMRGELGKAKNYFRNVPAGEPITLVAYRRGAQGLEVALRETVAESQISGLEFKPMSGEELKEVVNKIGLDPFASR